MPFFFAVFVALVLLITGCATKQQVHSVGVHKRLDVTITETYFGAQIPVHLIAMPDDVNQSVFVGIKKEKVYGYFFEDIFFKTQNGYAVPKKCKRDIPGYYVMCEVNKSDFVPLVGENSSFVWMSDIRYFEQPKRIKFYNASQENKELLESFARSVTQRSIALSN